MSPYGKHLSMKLSIGRDEKQNKEKLKDKSDVTTNQLLQTIVPQNQAKNETFQNALLAMMNTSMTMLQVRFHLVK